MTTIQTQFDQALLDTIKALTVQVEGQIDTIKALTVKVEGLKKDVNVLWSSAKTNVETLSSINRVMSITITRVNQLELSPNPNHKH